MLCGGKSALDILYPLDAVSNPQCRSARHREAFRILQALHTIGVAQGKAPPEIIRGIGHERSPVLQKTHDRITNTQSTPKNYATDWMEPHFKFGNDAEI